MKILFITITFIILASCGSNTKSATTTTVQTQERPNIIVIMSDDMGYSDIAPFGGEIETPNLDRMANNGMRLAQFYNNGRCCPTRASLLTGCYPHQAGIGEMTNPPENEIGHDLGIPEYQGFLSKNTVTIAEVLQEAGYATLMSGKWHVGMRDKSQWPLQRGFDKFYGITSGAANHFKPTDPRGLTLGNDPIDTGEDYYSTDAFTDRAIEFISKTEKEDPKKPFFLYMTYTAPHWPIQAPQKIVDKYKGKYKKGWTVLREQRYARMIELGIIDKNWSLTPQDSRSWDNMSQEQKEESDLRMAIYAAMVDRMDQNIGRLMNDLEAKGKLNNTLILFFNDNGACAEFNELGSGSADQLETKDGYVLSYGRAWANASNTPYRLYKHYVHEGGIATPFIAQWPDGIPKELNGTLVKNPNTYGFLPDIMATCVDLARANYPKKYKGFKIKPHVGKSLVPVFKHPNYPLHTEPIFWEHEGNKAVRLGKYKLVQKWERNREEWELYDMEKDRTEMNDITSTMPIKTQEMAKMYKNWAAKNNILPWAKILEMKKEQGK